MATLGQPLYSPESGWRRIDLSNYIDFFITNIDRSYKTAGNVLLYERVSKFNFTGTSIRFINGGLSSSSYPKITSVKVLIDDSVVFEQSVGTGYVLFYETTELENKEHYVQIIITTPNYNNNTWPYFRFNQGYVDILSSKYTISYNKHLLGRQKLSMLDVRRPGDYVWCGIRSLNVTNTSGSYPFILENLGGMTEESISLSKNNAYSKCTISTSSTKYFRFVFIGYTPNGKRKFISSSVFDVSTKNLVVMGSIGPEACITTVDGNACYKIRMPSVNEVVAILATCTLKGAIPPGTFCENISLNRPRILPGDTYTNASTPISSVITHCSMGTSTYGGTYHYYKYVSSDSLIASPSTFEGSNYGPTYLILEVDKDFIDFSNMKVSPTHVHTSNAPVEIRSIVPFHPLSTEHDRLVKFGVTINGVPYISPPAEFVPWNITHTLDMSIPYAYLAYGENTVEFSAVSKSKNSGKFSFKIYKEGEYRTIANRTFTSIDGGYITNNIKMGDVGAVEDLSRRGYITTTSKTNVNVARYGSIVKVTANSTGGKFLVSFDDRQNWYSFRNNAWVRVLPTNIDGFGMTAAQMGAVTTSDWQTIFKQTALDIMVQLELNETITGISVQLPNNVGPTIQSFDASPRSICQESVTVTAVVEDPENDALSYRLSINDGVYKNWSPSMPSPTVINEMLPFDIFTIGTDATTIKFEVRDIAGTVATRTARISRVEKPASEIVDYGADVQQAILNSDATIEDIYSAATHRYVALACLDGPMLPFKTE